MPTTQNRIEAAVTAYLQSLDCDWYEDLASYFPWNDKADEDSIKHAAKFGLEYIGKGCTRVVFRLKNTSLVVKIEKKSQHGCEHFERANEKEMEALEYYQDNFPVVSKFLLHPVHSFRYDGVTMLVYPEVSHDKEAGKLVDEDSPYCGGNEILIPTKAFSIIDSMLFDQCIGWNTYIIHDMPVSIDYGVGGDEYDHECKERYYNSRHKIISEITESEDFRSFKKGMDRIYQEAREEMYSEAA